MISVFGRKRLQAVLVIGCLVSLSGCYYMQAASGQLEVMNKREPIADVINASDTSSELATRLKLLP
jgi:predicted aminopeptidase